MLSLTSTHHPHTPGTLQKTSKLSTPRSKHREDHLSSSSSSQVVLFPPPSSSPPRTSLVPAPTAHAVEKKEGGDSSDVLTRSPSSTDPFPSSTDFFSSSSVKHSSESKPELQTSSHPAHAGLPYTRTVSTPRHDVHSTTTSPLLLASSSSLPLPSSKKEDSFPNLSENRGATPSSPSRRVLASPRGRDPSSGSSLTRVQDKNFAMNDEGHATNGDPTSRRKERKEEEEEGEMKETSATASRAGASLPSSSSSSQQEAPREESFGRPSSASLSPPRRERSRSKTVGGEKAGSLERERGRRHEREDSLVSRGVKKDQEDEDPVVGFFRSVFSKAPAEQKKRRDRSSSVNRPHLHRDYLVSSASRQPENSPLPDGEGRDGISATATISSKPSSSSSTVGQVHRHVDQKEGGKGEREEEEQHGEDSTTNAPSNALVEAAERREAFAFFETREGDTRTISKGASSLSLLSGGVGRRDPKGKKQQDKKEKHHHVKHGSSSASLVRGTPSFVSVNSTLSADRMNSTPVRGVRTPLSRGDGGGGSSSSSRILMNRTVLGPASQAASSRSWVSSRQLQNGRRGIGGEEGEEGKASQDTRVRSALFFATEERKKEGVIEEEEGRNANGDEEKDEERLTRKERRDELLVHRQSFDLGRERREGGEDEEGVDKKSYELSHERVTRDERGRDPYSSSSAAGGGGGLRSRPVGEALAGKVLPLEATASELAMKRIERRGKNRHLLKKEEEDEERDHPEEEEERDRKNDYKRNSLLHENKEEEKEDGKSDRHRPNSPIVLRALDPEEAEALKKHNSAGGSPLDHHSLEERRRRKEEEGEISREEEEKKRRKNYPNILSEVHGYYQASVSTVTRRRGDHHPTTHTSSTTQGVALYSELSAALATEATTTTTIPGTPNRPRPVARAVLVETSSSSASGEMTKNSQDSSKPPEDKTDQGRKEEDLKHQPSLVRAKTLVPKARPKRLATLTAGGTSQISSSSSSSVVRVDSPTENLIASTISPLLLSSPSHEG